MRKKVVGHNFSTEGPMDLRSTSLSCIFNALLGDTPLGHIFFAYGHMGISEKIGSSGVSPKKASKMELRDVDLRSVGHSVQKLWPTTFFAKKIPCIVHGAAKKKRHQRCR